ncbi:MAG: 50S ribosomal protein L21 [Berryella intestinalis]|uniref:50S ribosomal protein L21 n=1 Tax=Eggerthellaceae TaxID=1643826 RepID=UPI000F5381B7|nr:MULTISPECIES: 50S ribosomal protein L21 [Eggerthellaceae]MDD7369556.1 50S ribosomal protein L21 [Berryella intestinalis]MDY3129475.1 50S ribosomal protein L21 [Berryella intestinalis]
MYAIVKTGGKQYKVAPGDVFSIEKIEAEAGDKVELETICVVDGDKAEFDASKAAATKVIAEVIEQYKGKKQLVFKFKKRKNYKKLNGHRQNYTRVRVVSVGSEKAAAPAARDAE